MKNMDLYVECYGADHPLIAEVARLEAEVAGLRALLEAIRVAWVGLNTGPKPGGGWWANDIDNALAAQPAAPEAILPFGCQRQASCVEKDGHAGPCTGHRAPEAEPERCAYPGCEDRKAQHRVVCILQSFTHRHPSLSCHPFTPAPR